MRHNIFPFPFLISKQSMFLVTLGQVVQNMFLTLLLKSTISSSDGKIVTQPRVVFSSLPWQSYFWPTQADTNIKTFTSQPKRKKGRLGRESDVVSWRFTTSEPEKPVNLVSISTFPNVITICNIHIYTSI